MTPGLGCRQQNEIKTKQKHTPSKRPRVMAGEDIAARQCDPQTPITRCCCKAQGKRQTEKCTDTCHEAIPVFLFFKDKGMIHTKPTSLDPPPGRGESGAGKKHITDTSFGDVPGLGLGEESWILTTFCLFTPY